MDTLLAGGDHCPDARGLPVTLTGDEELMQRALIRLQVRRGSFAPDPALGSELYRLPRGEGVEIDRMAYGFVWQALQDLPEVAVQSVHCVFDGDELRVEVGVRVEGRSYELAAYVEGGAGQDREP